MTPKPLLPLKRDFLRPFNNARKDYKFQPRSRQIILAYIAAVWYIMWSLFLVITISFAPEQFQGWMLLAGIISTLIGTTLIWLWSGAAEGSFRPTLFGFGLFTLWFILVWGSTFILWPWQPFSWWVFGCITIWLGFVASLFLPMWHIEISQSQVYLDQRKSAGDEPLKTRIRPKIDSQLQRELLGANLDPGLLNRFLDYGGPAYMRPALLEKMNEGSEALVQRLYDVMASPKDKIKTALWVSALDNVTLFWDKSEGIDVKLELEQVVTFESTPIKVKIDYKFFFNPEDIHFPEFRTALPNIDPVKLKIILQAKMASLTESVTRQWFVNIPLQSAITWGSINEFRLYLPTRLSGEKHTQGITVNPSSIQCRPMIYPNVEAAEQDMMASRARAQADTAKIRALVDQVIARGVPPKLLAGLLMADGGVENWSVWNPDHSDVLDLPEARPDQATRYEARTYGGLLPPPPSPPPSLPDMSQLPVLPSTAPPNARLPQPENPSQPTVPHTPQPGQFTVPHPPQPGQNTVPHIPARPPSRRSIDLNKRMKERQNNGNVYQAREGEDGVFRVDDDTRKKP